MTAAVSLDSLATASPSRIVPGERGTRSFADAVAKAAASLDASPPASPNGSQLDATSALELQAAVYRHAERIELASKIVDLGVGAIRTLLQTRV